MLPWFKADTEEVFGGVMTFDWPCPAPKHLARIELQAIMLGPKSELWTHEKLAKRFNRPVSWVRALRREAGIKQAISSGQTDDTQDIDSKQTGNRQATDSKQTGIKQAFSLHTAENQTSVSSKQADDRQATDRQQTASKQAIDSHQADVKQPSCARASLDSRSEKETETENESEINTKSNASASIDEKHTEPSNNVEPTTAELKIPKMIESISQRADIEAWVNLWNDIKPAERDIFLDAVQVWDAYTTNCTTNARCLTTARYRMIRGLMKTYSADDLCEVPKGVQNHAWSKQTNQTNRFEWMFQQRNIEQFIQLAQNKTSKTDGLGRMQHGDDMGEIWTFKKTRS